MHVFDLMTSEVIVPLYSEEIKNSLICTLSWQTVVKSHGFLVSLLRLNVPFD